MSLPAKCSAPAKVNLALHVTGKLPGGFHAIDSLVAFCELGDELSLQHRKDGREVTLELTGPFASALSGASNLVGDAVNLLKERYCRQFEAIGTLHFTLEKNLPVASGVGGGSADAAAALLLLRQVLNLPVDDMALLELAAELGSDVPMCLLSSPLIARGRGIDVKPVAGLPALDVVLVNPGTAVSTPDVFAALEQKRHPPLDALPGQPSAGELVCWLARQRNDLQPPAMKIVPAIGRAIAELQHAGADLCRMSGSGATCFGLFSNAEQSQRAATAIASRNPGWWVSATETADFGMQRVYPQPGL